MNCPDCGNTGLRSIEQGPAGATYTVHTACKCQTPTVTILRAQYEAMMAAAKALTDIHPDFRSTHANEALAALRAAGIEGEYDDSNRD